MALSVQHWLTVAVKCEIVDFCRGTKFSLIITVHHKAMNNSLTKKKHLGNSVTPL